MDTVGKKLWARGYSNRILKSQKAKRIKTEEKGPSRTVGQFTKGETYTQWGTRGRRRERKRRNISNNNDWEFLQISIRLQTTDSISLRTPSMISAKCQQNKETTPRHIVFRNYRKLNIKEKSWKKPEGKKPLPIEEQR